MTNVQTALVVVGADSMLRFCILVLVCILYKKNGYFYIFLNSTFNKEKPGT